MYIVQFPAEWYMRSTTATGDIERADRFNTREEATLALQQRSKWFKPAYRKAAKIVEVA
jgi:hypothetical protein